MNTISIQMNNLTKNLSNINLNESPFRRLRGRNVPKTTSTTVKIKVSKIQVNIESKCSNETIKNKIDFNGLDVEASISKICTNTGDVEEEEEDIFNTNVFSDLNVEVEEELDDEDADVDENEEEPLYYYENEELPENISKTKDGK